MNKHVSDPPSPSLQTTFKKEKSVFKRHLALNFTTAEHLPYADDSTAVTPKSEMNGGIIVDTPTKIGLRYEFFPTRKYSLQIHYMNSIVGSLFHDFQGGKNFLLRFFLFFLNHLMIESLLFAEIRVLEIHAKLYIGIRYA